MNGMEFVFIEEGKNVLLRRGNKATHTRIMNEFIIYLLRCDVYRDRKSRVAVFNSRLINPNILFSLNIPN